MQLFFFCLLFFSASRLTEKSTRSYFVVWNVGQGQWTSAINNEICLHFDIGGEFFPLKKIFASCADKKNMFFISHWDWDHIGGLEKIKPTAFKFTPCVAARPQTSPKGPRKRKLLTKWGPCEQNEGLNKIKLWRPVHSNTANEESLVFMFKNILIPGDSPISQEQHWISQPWVPSSQILILGHHGSATSTSADLLKGLPRVRMSISSARWARYHHPHPEVESRLKKFSISLLRTEDWGNIWIEI